MSSSNATSHPAGKVTKLKASCDFCALSKIKCDRGQPQCQRCTKNGIVCHYSETRRIGKARQVYAASHPCSGIPTNHTSTLAATWPPRPSWTPQGEPKSKNYTAGGTRRTPPSKNPIHGDEQCGSFDYAMPSDLFENFLSPTPELIATSLGHARPAGTQTQVDCSRSENMPVPFLSPESPGDFLANNNLGGTADLASSDTSNMTDPDLTGERIWDADAAVSVSEPFFSTARHTTTDCIHRISAVLQTLHAARACVRSEQNTPSKPPVSLDVALQNNRMATDTVRETLDCPCSRGMSVALLQVLIMHQVMESYRTVLSQQYQHQHRHQSGPLSPGSTPRDRSAPDSSSDYVRLPMHDIPLCIGGYLLDDNMRAKVVVQVIHSELQTIGSLLDAIARHAERMRNQPEEVVLGTYVEALRTGLHELSHSLDRRRIDG